jgi:hypothetical protein
MRICGRVLMTAIIAFLGEILLLPAIAGTNASSATDPTAKLSIWVGRWHYSERDYETPFSHARINSGTANCSWSADRGFVVCDYVNSNAGNGVPANDLAVFTYDSTSKLYARIGVFKVSKPTRAKLTVKGNTWIALTQFPYHGKTYLYRDVQVFLTPTQRQTSAQVSGDNGKTWTTVSQFTAVKTGAA